MDKQIERTQTNLHFFPLARLYKLLMIQLLIKKKSQL